MAKPLVSDQLWELIARLLPPQPPKPTGDRPRVPGRAALSGILFVLRSGISWEMLPQEMGCGSAMACWRRLQEWQAAGVWEQLRRVLLDSSREADRIDWSRAVVNSASVRAVLGTQTGPNPTGRARAGSKHHQISDAQGIPLAVVLTAANVNDVTQLEALVGAIPPVRGKRGRPRQRPEIVQGDRGYGSEEQRRWVRKKRIRPLLAEVGAPHGSGLGKRRWVVERTRAWLHHFRRLRTRWERRDDVHLAFLQIGCAPIAFSFL